MSVPHRVNEIAHTTPPDNDASGVHEVAAGPLWSVVAEDMRHYAELHYPAGAGALRRWLLWLHAPGLLVLFVHRVHFRLIRQSPARRNRPAMILFRLLFALVRGLRLVVSKSDVAPIAVIGRRVYLSDRGYQILGPRRIGNDTVIHERVVVGVRAGAHDRPTISANVWIGPDCVIYGDITIGRGATVLPGSVLSMDVPPGAVVGGNPATFVRDHFDNSALRRSLSTRIDRAWIAAQ